LKFRFSFAFCLCVLLVLNTRLSAQDRDASLRQAFRLLETRNEVCIEFEVPGPGLPEHLSGILSIDAVTGKTVRAYANPQQFREFLTWDLPFRVIPPVIRPVPETKSLAAWESYPSYSEYLDMMQAFETGHPSLCRLVNAGKSVGNRDILFVKISDHVEEKEPEPVVLFSSTMHGDETVGYVLMLLLIDTLLTGYGHDPQITALVDSLEIWINPLANPDGTYYNSPSGEITNPRRYNDNGYDLNRNFPDPRVGENPGGPYQEETLAMMAFMDTLKACLSANFHGGAEVVNYPWDTWYPSVKVHPDQLWFQYIGHEYADTVHLYGPEGYMNPSWSDNGITNGAEWYSITGSRQDYVTYFLHGREVTIELSNTKFPDPATLPLYWEYNRRSLLHYLEQAFFGVHGFVTDAYTGDPVPAHITLPGHDSLGSGVVSDSVNGFFVRLLHEGNWNMMFTAGGYEPVEIPVQVWNRQQTRLDVRMVPVQPSPPLDSTFCFRLVENPPGGAFRFEYHIGKRGSYRFILYTLTGRPVQLVGEVYLEPGEGELEFPLPPDMTGMYVMVVSGPEGNFSMKIFLK